jgi:hypothetical protein
MRSAVAAMMVGCLGWWSPMTAAAQTAAPQAQAPDAGTAKKNAQGSFTLQVNANIVLTNVVVRDKKTGAVVKGLKASDFTIIEDKRQQTIASFDYQNVDEAAVLAEKNTVAGKASDR